MIASCHARVVRAALLLLLFALPASAETQPLSCPDDAESCELELEGKLTYSKRDRLAKWDNLRIASKGLIVHASINIPHRTRLKLKVGTRYRFKVAAHKPFGARDLWVVDAR